jgi:hypothetical protein
MVPRTFVAAIRHWPTADLAELLYEIHRLLTARSDHHQKGGGIEAEIASHPSRKRSQQKRGVDA